MMWYNYPHYQTTNATEMLLTSSGIRHSEENAMATAKSIQLPLFKRCITCGEVKPANTEYFYKHSSISLALKGSCKNCCIARNTERQKTPERKIYMKTYGELPKQRAYRKIYYITKKEEGYYQSPERKAYAKSPGRKAYDKIRGQLPHRKIAKTIYCQSPQGKAAQKRYRQSPEGKARQERYNRSEKGKISFAVNNIRRKTRKLNLPVSFIPQDWLCAIEYFHGCCAVCGRQAHDLFATHTLAQDHWIPLSDPRPDNPGTVPTNIVPLCHGVDGCNNSKSNRNPVEWLTERYGVRKAKSILKRINAYFDSLRK